MKKGIIGLLFVLPAVTFTFILRYIPILISFYMSLFEYNFINPPGKMIGFENYLNIFSSEYYWAAWKNNLVFLLLILCITFLPPLIQAIALSEILRGRKLISTIYLIASLIPLSITVILWKWVWNPDIGLANYILKVFNMQPQQWLNDPNLVKFSIVFPGIIGGGIAVLIYLAAILNVSSEVVEAARIDGCVGFKK